MARMVRLSRLTANEDQKVLVNPNNVAQVRPVENRSGSRLYFTFASGQGQTAEWIEVRETLDEVEAEMNAALM